ncbi:hypothetical protein [Acinetobacter baumannii]|uniref:hypothetical protein n=1 Tax=Acinetobacter baumannii TaxID=470 RepID=UPI0003477850|nr:hypothetical protein [Acinetobacter baumannii]
MVYGTIADLEDKDNTGIVGILVLAGDYLWRGPGCTVALRAHLQVVQLELVNDLPKG